ncbi:S24 family peptidase [Halorhodospira abdelmalekii]|uniref:S24 family peptidase n=1 Tax=Halorhodospira abdelmalekii TaxID=421629 RepID=UPI0019040235
MQSVEPEGWVRLDTGRKLQPGMFVAQVVGKSMEPRIPDAAWCLFRSPVIGTRRGKVVIVQLRDQVDPETGERYTVKRYESEKTVNEEGWRHSRIVLRPDNHDFEPIVLTEADEGTLQVIAELVEVLGSPRDESKLSL